MHMKKIKYFDIFGVEYKTVQFSAAESFPMIERIAKLNPLDILPYTSVKCKDEYIILNNEKSINKYVVDKINHVPNFLVLRALLSIVTDFNFSFLANFKPVKIPSKFAKESKSVFSKYIDIPLSQLIQNQFASLKELEEYYSLEDAFILFDVMISKGINEAYSIDNAGK